MSCLRGCCETQALHYKSVTISTGPSLRSVKETVLGNDLDAYQRLVKSGAKPKGIDGAAELERFASTSHEVEHRNIITDDKLRAKVTRAFADTAIPAVTPLDAA